MKITLGNWLYNAGIIGFVRILAEGNKDCIKKLLKDDYIELEPSMLDGFEYKYAAYVFKNCFNPLDLLWVDVDIENNREILQKIKQELNNQYSDELYKWIIRRDLKSFKSSLNRILKSIKHDFNKMLCEKNFNQNDIDKLNSKLLKNLQRKKQKNIADDISNFDFLYKFLTRFYLNKAVIGNPSFKGNRLEGFAKTYVEPAKQVLQKKIFSKNGVLCRFCNQVFVEKPKVFEKSLFSIVATSSEEFSNFFLNSYCDLFICPVCELILLCAFAGFTEIPAGMRDELDRSEYIFVNMPSLELIYKENAEIMKIYRLSEFKNKESIYEEVFDNLILKEKTKKSWWVLQNIFFVEIKPEKRKIRKVERPVFKYFHIGRDLAILFTDKFVIDSLKKLKGSLTIQKKVHRGTFRVKLKKEAIRRLLADDDLYFLANLNLKRNIEYYEGKEKYFHNPDNSFNLAFVQNMKKIINIKIKIGGENMPLDSQKVDDILKSFLEEGKKLNTSQDFKKRIQLSYRLLSLIRAGKYKEFYQDLMKLYISSKRPIPETLIGLLNTQDPIDFEAKAYAFMSGFLQNQEYLQNNTTIQTSLKLSQEGGEEENG